jgi:hypothetical protein
MTLISETIWVFVETDDLEEAVSTLLLSIGHGR